MFIGILPRLLTAFVALGGIASGLPAAANDKRAVNVAPGGGRVVVDGGGVYMRSTRLNDGSLIGGYHAVDAGNHVLRVAKSTNNGDSWTQIGTVASGPTNQHDIDNADVIQLPGGRILFAFRNHDHGSGGFTYYRITVCYSDDGGRTWSFLSQIDERGANGVNGLWEPFFRLARDGTLQAFYSAENNGGDQDNIMKFSKDGGKSWSTAHPVSGQGLTSRDGMTGVANVDGNGNLICVFENTEIGRFSIDYVLSQDDGYSWNSRGRVYTSAREAGAPQVINVGGTLVASFMTNEDDGNVGQIDGGRMKVVTSTNGGHGWSQPTTTGDRGSHWPGLQVLDSRQFLALYAIDGTGLVSQKYHL